jgi:hypothetical protein
MKLSYEPGRVVGGAAALVGAVASLLIHYEVVTPEAAALWSSLAMILVPVLQAEITRRRTVPVAKIEDAEQHTPAINVESITAAADATRRRRHATRSGGPATPSGSHAPPR